MTFTMTGADPNELWPLVRDHHYSGRMPTNIQHCYVVRKPGGLLGDSGEPIAGIIFSFAQAKWSEPVLELSRLVRHPDYTRPLTEFIAFAVKWLRKANWDLIISYADWTEKHHGGIYQAASWFYSGKRNKSMDGLIIDGVFKPGRSCNAEFGTRSPSRLKHILVESDIQPNYDEGKHLYWKPLNVSGRLRAKKMGLEQLRYPKPDAANRLGLLPEVANFVQSEGAIPTIQLDMFQ